MQINQWENALNDSLHCVRPFHVFSATNATTNERMFPSKKVNQWLIYANTAYDSRKSTFEEIRQSKYDSLVHEVDLI